MLSFWRTFQGMRALFAQESPGLETPLLMCSSPDMGTRLIHEVGHLITDVTQQYINGRNMGEEPPLHLDCRRLARETKRQRRWAKDRKGYCCQAGGLMLLCIWQMKSSRSLGLDFQTSLSACTSTIIGDLGKGHMSLRRGV